MRRTLLIALFGFALSVLLPAAGRAGQEVRGKKTAEWLRILLDEKEPKKRRAAIIALEIIGPKGDRVLQGLGIALKQDPEPEIRREVAQAIGRMGEDARLAIPALTAALNVDKDGTVREAAARALGGLVPHSRSGVPELARALQDSYPGTR